MHWNHNQLAFVLGLFLFFFCFGVGFLWFVCCCFLIHRDLTVILFICFSCALTGAKPRLGILKLSFLLFGTIVVELVSSMIG